MPRNTWCQQACVRTQLDHASVPLSSFCMMGQAPCIDSTPAHCTSGPVAAPSAPFATWRCMMNTNAAPSKSCSCCHTASGSGSVATSPGTDVGSHAISGTRSRLSVRYILQPINWAGRASAKLVPWMFVVIRRFSVATGLKAPALASWHRCGSAPRFPFGLPVVVIVTSWCSPTLPCGSRQSLVSAAGWLAGSIAPGRWWWGEGCCCCWVAVVGGGGWGRCVLVACLAHLPSHSQPKWIKSESILLHPFQTGDAQSFVILRRQTTPSPS